MYGRARGYRWLYPVIVADEGTYISLQASEIKVSGICITPSSQLVTKLRAQVQLHATFHLGCPEVGCGSV